MHCGNHSINNLRRSTFAFLRKTFSPVFRCINGRFQRPQKCPTPPFLGNGNDIFSRVVQKSFKIRGFFERVEFGVRFFRRFILYPYYNWFWKQQKR